MDENKRELINHLYAIATGMLNDAEELAVRGQSHSVTENDICTVSSDVLAKLDDTAALVKAGRIIAGT